MKKDGPLFAYFGHHKCASRWINGILKQVCSEVGICHRTVYNYKWFGSNLQMFVNENNIDFITYSNADYKYVANLENFLGFHVIRDPRDVCVSAYFSHLLSHETDIWPELIPHREKLQTLSKEDGLLLDMKFMERFMNEMFTWNYSQPNVLELKMENLTQNPYRQFLEIFEFLGILDRDFHLKKRSLYIVSRYFSRYENINRKFIQRHIKIKKIPAERLLGIIWENDFKKKAEGRKPGKENIQSHYRKGIPGDWRNHFTEKHIDFFKSNYNQVLLKLGYEQDPEWA